MQCFVNSVTMDDGLAIGNVLLQSFCIRHKALCVPASQLVPVHICASAVQQTQAVVSQTGLVYPMRQSAQ